MQSRTAGGAQPGYSDSGREAASRGTNQNGVRAYNERLILSLIRRNISLSKIEITNLTGLSAQTISGIVNALEGNGLLRRPVLPTRDATALCERLIIAAACL